MKAFATVDTLIKALEQTKENSRGREGTPKDLGDLAIVIKCKGKRYINSKLIGVCLPLSGSWDITRESFCNMIGNEKEYDKKLNDSIQKEMALRREVAYEETSKDYKSYKRRMELLKLMTEQKEANKNEL